MAALTAILGIEGYVRTLFVAILQTGRADALSFLTELTFGTFMAALTAMIGIIFKRDADFLTIVLRACLGAFGALEGAFPCGADLVVRAFVAALSAVSVIFLGIDAHILAEGQRSGASFALAFFADVVSWTMFLAATAIFRIVLGIDTAT